MRSCGGLIDWLHYEYVARNWPCASKRLLSRDPLQSHLGERGLFAAGVFGAFKHNCMNDHAL